MRFEGHFESVKNLWHPSIGTKISHADNPWLHSVCYWSEINKIINEEKNQDFFSGASVILPSFLFHEKFYESESLHFLSSLVLHLNNSVAMLCNYGSCPHLK